MQALLLAGLMLVFVGIAHATDVVKVQDIEVKADEGATLAIVLDNTTSNLMGWQCDIVLPDGLSLQLKANGKPAATLGDRFAVTEHTISSSSLSNGAYRYIATSMDGEAIPGSGGTLFTVTLLADASLAPGTVLTGKVTNIEFNTQDNQKVTLDDVTFSVTISGEGTTGGDNPGDEEPDTSANRLTVADMSLAPSGSATLDVALDNTTSNLMGWQCDIVLPDGLSLQLKANGKPAATLGDRFATTEHTISSSRLTNGAYRFIATSMGGEAIPGNSGTLFNITIQADASLLAGTILTGTVQNIEFNTQDNQKVIPQNVEFKIRIKPRQGDVNGDGSVTVADVSMIVNMILGNEAKVPDADVNGDGTVSVADVTQLVKIILGR